jgi:hypothetical protein
MIITENHNQYKVEEHVEADQEVNKLLFESLKQHADLTYDKCKCIRR